MPEKKEKETPHPTGSSKNMGVKSTITQKKKKAYRLRKPISISRRGGFLSRKEIHERDADIYHQRQARFCGEGNL